MQTKKSDNRLQTVVRLSWRLRVTLAFQSSLIPAYNLGKGFIKGRGIENTLCVSQPLPLIRLGVPVGGYPREDSPLGIIINGRVTEQPVTENPLRLSGIGKQKLGYQK